MQRKEKHNECQREYMKRTDGYRRRREKEKTQRVRYLARRAVRREIKRGSIAKQPCEICGSPKAQAHHDDYLKRLDVRWLCSQHHAEWHKHNTPLNGDVFIPPDSGKPKLTKTQILKIRELIASGTRMREIAVKFGVCYDTIRHIRNGRTWKNVA